jgi:hypothetical protein
VAEPSGVVRPTGRDGVAIRIFSLSCVAWLLLRFLPGTAVPSPGVSSSLSVVRASPSPTAGVFEISGVPSDDPAGLFRAPEIVAAMARLQGRVAGANEALALAAQEIASRIEPFPEEEVTGLRLSGVLVPFYGPDAARLSRAREEATERPWLTLETVRESVDGRLSEPDDGVLVADAARRRELTRLLRNTENVLEDESSRVARALDEFRREALQAATRAQGPFRRHGTGRILELVLAAWLGATLREALRRRPGPVPVELSMTFAPVLAAAVILMLEGSTLLPIDPVRGLSLAFVPLAFVLGFGCSSILLIASRLDRVLAPDAPVAVAPPARAPEPVRPAPARPGPPPFPRAGEVPVRPAPAPAPAPPSRPRTEREVEEVRLPFFPKKPRG